MLSMWILCNIVFTPDDVKQKEAGNAAHLGTGKLQVPIDSKLAIEISMPFLM